MQDTSSSNPKPKRGAGRPSLYRPEYDEQGRKLCLLGATDQEMADIWGVSVRSVREWLAVHESFSQSIARGKALADAEVASRLFERACGFRQAAVKLYRNDDGSVTQAPYVIEHPPDTQAASLWLRNRRRVDWRDKHEVEVADAGESLLDTMSEEQLIQRLMMRRKSKSKDSGEEVKPS